MALDAAAKQRAHLKAEHENGVLRLGLEGRLDALSVADVWGRARDHIQETGATDVIVDASGIDYCDTTGAAFLYDLGREQKIRGGRLRLEGFPKEFEPILEMLSKEGPGVEEKVPETPPSFLADLGALVATGIRDTADLVRATGEITVALVQIVRRPSHLRLRDFRDAFLTAGVNALPIVVLVAFLLGLILSYQTAVVFHRYGAGMHLATMIGLGFVRELGPLMTAIVLTARSGSAFAAELGTMKVRSEVDALTTMGIDPVPFLMNPRIVAGVFVTPLLTVFANFAGILGGVMVWTLNMGLPWQLYRDQIIEEVDLLDFFGGLFKALVFGVLVVGVGCIRGLQTTGAARAVGRAATRAVVSGTVLIALSDAVLAFVYFNLGI